MFWSHTTKSFPFESALSKTTWHTYSHDILFQHSFWDFSWRKYLSCFQLQGIFHYSGMGHKGQRLKKKRQIANSWVYGICIIQFSVLNFWSSCIIFVFTLKTDPLLGKERQSNSVIKQNQSVQGNLFDLKRVILSVISRGLLSDIHSCFILCMA